jgi:iturin family lipopeptide synthetase B
MNGLKSEEKKDLYWITYKEFIPSSFSYSFERKNPIIFNIKLADCIRKLSKMNVYNASILLSVSILKQFSNSKIYENVSIGLKNQFIPLPDCTKYSIEEATKFVLSQFRQHLNHLPVKDFEPCLVNFYQDEPNKKSIINLKIDESLKNVEVILPSNFQVFAHQLCKDAFDLLEKIGTDKKIEFSDALLHEYKAITQNKLPKIVAICWSEIHSFPLILEKSYIENGGDSIKAIRFLSRLQREGYFTDLSSLLDATRMSEWKIEYRGIKNKIVDKNVKNYPLSATQQLIWEDWSSLNQQHIYHEQFLFKLDKCPSPEILKATYEQIWEKYPQLRVKIHFEENGYQQCVQENEADFRILTGKEIDEVLNADLSVAFEKSLMRCSFIDVNDTKYLLWSHHHVLLDGWSVGKLIAEFIEVIEHDSPKLTLSPNHQQILVSRENSRRTEMDAEYWERFFSDKTALTLPKQTIENGKYEIFTAKLDGIKSFRSVSETAAISFQSYLLTHFFLTVYSIDSKNKTYLHSISSGRNLIPEFTEEAVGLFIRNIIPGFELSEEDTMLSLLKNFNRNFIKTVEMEFTEPAMINAYQEQRPDVLFVFENYPYNAIKGEKISGSLIFNHELTGYPLTFLIMPEEDSLNIKIIYDSGRFSPIFINALYSKFCSLLLHFKDNLDQKVYQLEISLENLSSETEIFPLWYDEIIRKTALSKNQISSSNRSEKIAYEKLEELSASFATYFKDLKKGSRIAVIGDKNEELPALAYSIMRNGYVYLPLNNAWPKNRILQTLEIANCSHIVISDDSEILKLPDYISVYKDVFSAEPLNTSNFRPAMEDEAYLLFTSGSSGVPKGVSLSHANLSSFFDACKDYCNAENYDLIFSFTNIGFDLSIFENLFGFYVDKPIHVIQKAEQLWEELQKHNRVLLNTVPSVLDRLSWEEIKNISVVHTAGEPFRLSGWKHLKESNPNIKIFNWYGPTETTTYSTCIDLSEDFEASIGKALKHELIFLSDGLGIEQIEGLPGEIIIGGTGVGRYLKAEKNKFLNSSKFRFYGTGDRAYFKNNILYLIGREDRQVKRLGQRFELSEIENWISGNFNPVKRVYYHKSENEQFVLFIEAESIAEDEVKSALNKHFPKYMLPDLIILKPSFPENNNGKMDISQMLKEINNIENNYGFETELLTSLKQKEGLFKGLKGDLSFTAQGGDSIIGLKIIGKMKKMGYKIEISDLLNATNLNECFNKLSFDDTISVSIPENTILLSPVQKWFKENYSGNPNHFNQSVLLELFLPLSSNEIFEKVKKCFNSIEILQKIFDGNWKMAKAPIFEFIDIQQEHEITAHCEKLQRSFNLLEGPVAAIALFKSTNAVYLFISIHHFYCDGVSWRVLMDYLQDSLSGIDNSHSNETVFGKVQVACHDMGKLDEEKDYYPKIISNPFQKLEVCSYKESEFRSLEWNNDRSDHFLRNWNKDYSINEKFVSFFLHNWLRTNQPQTAIFLETHGRQYSGIPEIAEAIGWFTQFYPLSENDYPNQLDEIQHYVKQSFAKLPNYGLGYMGLKNWQKDPFPLLLNFLGSFDENWNSMANPVNFDQSNQVDPENPMLAYVEINGIILEGRIRWMFRSHPEFPMDLFVREWESNAGELLKENVSQFYSDESIDKEDMDKISEMLNIQNL